AHLPPAQRETVLGTALERFTARTVQDPSVLRRQLEQVVERGWALAEEEFEEGLNAVAAPIHGTEGEVVAALSAAGPAYRLGHDRLPAAAEQLRAAAAEISRRLGHHPRSPESTSAQRTSLQRTAPQLTAPQGAAPQGTGPSRARAGSALHPRVLRIEGRGAADGQHLGPQPLPEVL